MSRSRSLLLLSTLIPLTTLLAACGADDIASPGTGGDVIINPPAPTPPAPPPPPPPAATVTPASGCPTIADPQGLTDSGTIAGPGTTGSWRVCTLPARINRSIQLTKIPGLLYRLGGRTDVGTDGGPTASASDSNVTLTIDPGVVIFAGSGVSWLAVNRGNKIQAVGTATQPIIFTSQDNVRGINTDASSGQWGGVVLLGRAPITDCENPGAAPGTTACERQTEGAVDPAKYGGATVNDNSGRMSYVQIRYSGFVLSGNSELQSLTTSGTGTGTQLDHIMSFNSSDDGAEFFGGRVNMKYFVSIGAEDDNLDTDVGVKGNFQYVLAVQRNGIGDSMIEADSDNAADGNTPRQNVRVSNATFIQRSNGGPNLTAMLLRGGTDYTLANSVVVSPGVTCLRISRANTIQAADPAQDEAGPPVFRSVQMTCGTPKYTAANGVTEAQVASIFGTGTNNNNDAYVSTLTSIFVNGATEAAVPVFDATSIDAFFDRTTYIGAVRDATDNWYKGWTCNSTTADLGGSGLCTAIPTT